MSRRALLACLLLALLQVHPVLSAPTQLALGHADADTYNHVWGFHQVVSALLEGSSPFHTLRVGHPDGGALWFIDLFNALWTAPVQLLGGPVLAYNVACFANLALAGFAAWGLARQAGAGEGGAALAAVAYQAQPQLMAQLHNGISETLSVGWLPLALWAFLVFRQRPARRTGLLAGAALCVCGLSNWYYGLFAGLAALGFVLSLRGHRGRQVAGSLGWAALGALPLVPALWLFRATLNAEDALVLRDPDFVLASLVGHNMVDLLSFFHPGDFRSPDLKVLFDEELRVTTYIGWLVLVPALMGLRSARARPWLGAGLVCFVFALGPFLYYAGGYAQVPGGGAVPLPFLALFEGIPLFSAISHAFRFAVPLQLCLAVAAGLVVGGRGFLLSGAVLVELLWLSPAPWPAPVAPTSAPPVYELISDEGAVLDLPVTVQVLARSRYDLYQLSHGRPIPYGFNDPTPAALRQNRLGSWLIDLERSSEDSLPPQPTLDLVLGLRALRAEGYAAIVVHEELYPPPIRAKVLQQLRGLMGPGETRGEATVFLL